MKKIILLIPCFFILFGCQTEKNNKVELNQNTGQILPVSAVAIEKTKNEYKMTIESIKQDSLDGEVTPTYFSVYSNNFENLFNIADEMLASRLYLSHACVFIIDENIAKNDIKQLSKALLTRQDARLTLRLAVCSTEKPEKILKAPSITQGISGMEIASLLEKRSKDGSVCDFPLFRIIDYMYSDKDISLPVLILSPDGHCITNGNIIISSNGGAYYA